MRILIVYTGGTIGCVGRPLRPMDGPAFEAAFTQHVTPIVQREYSDIAFGFQSFSPTLDSTNMQPADWCEIAIRVLANYADHDAFIVLHGTDSMAWTASALSFLLTGLRQDRNPIAALTKPVIVTGSQLPLFHRPNGGNTSTLLFNTDALQNVCGAVASAAAGVAEVGLYFNNTLMRGNRTLKTSASEFPAFSSPNYPPLAQSGVLFVQQVQNLLPPAPPRLALDQHLPELLEQVTVLARSIAGINVLAFPAFPAWARSSGTPNAALLASLLQASLAQGISGLILESYGAGNFPSGNPATPVDGAIRAVLKKAQDDGVVVVNCTQVLAGNVDAAIYAAGSWLSDCGVIGANDMTPIASLAKLLVLQGLNHACHFGWTPVQVKALMQRSLAGEITAIDRLDGFGTGILAPGQSLGSLDGSVQLLNDPKRGPLLFDRRQNGSRRFRLLEDPGFMAPGRLHVADNGTVTFTDRRNEVVRRWVPGGPASACQLILPNLTSTPPTLVVWSAETNTDVMTILSSPDPDPHDSE